MTTHFVPGVRLAAVSCAVPQNEIFNTGANERPGKAVGVASRRHVSRGTSFLDLAAAASQAALRDALWPAVTVDALVVVTQSQARRIPSVACELHRDLGMAPSAPAFDLGLACSGYVYGLWVASSLRLPRVLLVVGDTISRFLDANDPGTYPIFGDGVSATCIEAVEVMGGLSFTGGTDGRGAESLACPHDGDGYLRMAGQDVFDFAISTVPPLVQQVTMNGFVDWYLFHQANAMMIRHIAKKAKLDTAKVPINMGAYGNTSSCSIPLLMCDSDCTESLRTGKRRVAMFGFGAGYSYGGVLMDIGPLPLSVVEV